MSAIQGPIDIQYNKVDGADYSKQGDGPTILDALRAFERDGFEGQFSAQTDSGIKCLSCRGSFRARRVTMHGMCRVEGTSDPDDMVAIAALSCPACDERGTIVLKYGPMATEEELTVLHDLRDERTEHSLESC